MINGVYKPTYNWGGTILYWQYTDNTQLTKNEWTSLLLQILGHARPLNDGQLVWGVAPQLGICTAKIFEALFSSSKFLHKSSSKSSKSSNRLATSHNTGNRSDGSDFLRYRPSGGHSPWTDRWKHRTRFSRAWAKTRSIGPGTWVDQLLPTPQSYLIVTSIRLKDWLRMQKSCCWLQSKFLIRT